VQLGLPFAPLVTTAVPRTEPSTPAPAVSFVRMRCAKRYIIRVRPDGSLRVTIPRGGSNREARAFLEEQRRWADRERMRVLAQHAPAQWKHGDEVLLRGHRVPLRVVTRASATWLMIGDEGLGLSGVPADLRPAAEKLLTAIARRELIPRMQTMALAHHLTVERVVIRNQRARWGSCSRSGSIALNFRLVQTPNVIRDYVLIHELMHLKQPNHSRRFWRLVEGACPGFREAERWLRTEGRSLF
jgi:predicted metal-dependent hydrolase